MDSTLPYPDLNFVPLDVLTAEEMNEIVANVNALAAAIPTKLLAAFPVGTIKITTTNVNPGTYLGGTWVAWGAGRVPVGVGSNGTHNYTDSGMTGGGDTHTHSVSIDVGEWYGKNSFIRAGQGGSLGLKSYNPDGSVSTGTEQNIGAQTSYHNASGTETQTNQTGAYRQTGNTSYGDSRMPYITCYMWRRTA